MDLENLDDYNVSKISNVIGFPDENVDIMRAAIIKFKDSVKEHLIKNEYMSERIGNQLQEFDKLKQMKHFVSSTKMFDAVRNKKIIDLLKSIKSLPKGNIEFIDRLKKIGEGQNGAAYKLNKMVVKKNCSRRLSKLHDHILYVDKPTHEFIVSSISNYLNTINICFLRYYGYFYGNKCSSNGVYAYNIMEMMGGNVLTKYFKKVSEGQLMFRILRFEEFKSILFQIIFACVTMQKKFKMTHNDMHTGNIGMSFFNGLNKKKLINMKFGKFEWFVDNPGYLIRIFDYDLSYIGYPRPIVSHDIGGLKYAGINPKFQPGYDIMQVVAYFISEYNKLDIKPWLKEYRAENPEDNKTDEELYQLFNIDIKKTKVNVLYSIKDYDLYSKFFDTLVGHIYRIAKIKNRRLYDFHKTDYEELGEKLDNYPKKNKQGYLFKSEYRRPIEELSAIDFSELLKTNLFNEYVKPNYSGDYMKIANIQTQQ